MYIKRVALLWVNTAKDGDSEVTSTRLRAIIITLCRFSIASLSSTRRQRSADPREKSVTMSTRRFH